MQDINFDRSAAPGPPPNSFTDISALRRPGAVTCVLEHSAKNLFSFCFIEAVEQGCRSKSRSSEAAATVFFKSKLTGTNYYTLRALPEGGNICPRTSSEMFRCPMWSCVTLVRSRLFFSMKDSFLLSGYLSSRH